MFLAQQLSDDTRERERERTQWRESARRRESASSTFELGFTRNACVHVYVCVRALISFGSSTKSNSSSNDDDDDESMRRHAEPQMTSFSKADDDGDKSHSNNSTNNNLVTTVHSAVLTKLFRQTQTYTHTHFKLQFDSDNLSCALWRRFVHHKFSSRTVLRAAWHFFDST